MYELCGGWFLAFCYRSVRRIGVEKKEDRARTRAQTEESGATGLYIMSITTVNVRLDNIH